MLKVLIVDNETAIREGLIHCLDWASLDCEIAMQARDGIEALELISMEEPDIIISDIRMPGMDGLQLAEHVNQCYPHIKIIIITGFPDFDYAQKAISYRVVDFVLKPTSAQSLTAAIEKAQRQIYEERNQKELSERLKTESKQNIALHQNLFLYHLIHKANVSFLYALNQLHELNIHLTNYYVVRLQLLANEDTFTDFLPQLSALETLFMTALSDTTAFFISTGDQSAYVIICAQSGSDLIELCNEAFDLFAASRDLFLSIGISSCFDDPLQLPLAADQAQQAQHFSMYSNEYRMMFFNEIPSASKEDIINIFDTLKKLRSSIEHQNFEKATALVKEIFRVVYSAQLPIREVYNLYHLAYSYCMEALLLQNAETGNIVSIKALSEQMHIHDIELLMHELVQNAIQNPITDKNSVNQLISTIQEYICSHFEHDISLQSLAGMVYLSPSYLSRLFKKQTGKNISTYIQNIRIEKAKTLLLTTNLKTYEVAERVGIPDPVYFSRIFKKVTGCKPKDYRTDAI